jgi:RNA polymerase sigma factor (sigma-70 family)
LIDGRAENRARADIFSPGRHRAARETDLARARGKKLELPRRRGALLSHQAAPTQEAPMARPPLADVLHALRSRAPGRPAVPDGALLRRFAAAGDAGAFEEILRRHGPLVWRVCARGARDRAAAEDAFQATFLVLARRAATVRRPEALPAWLHAVAARAARATRGRAAAWAGAEVATEADPLASLAARELAAALDEELARLPERLRVPLVLCHLDGRTHGQAAAALGLSPATLKRRLLAGRRLLRARLEGRGLGLPAALLAAGLAGGVAQARVPAGLAGATIAAATGVAGARPGAAAGAALLTGCLLRGMLMEKLRLAAVAAVAVAVLGAGGVALRAGGAGAGEGAGPPAAAPTDPEGLRRENALLRLNLEVVLEKVRAQEAELKTLRGEAARAGRRAEQATYEREVLAAQDALARALAQEERRALGVWLTKPAADPVAEAEAALKALREARDPAEKKKAADGLERALKRLREQMK